MKTSARQPDMILLTLFATEENSEKEKNKRHWIWSWRRLKTCSEERCE